MTGLRCKLSAGDLVEVKSAEEILSSLDADGATGGLPFMPEMLRFCGSKMRVGKRAHKSCDTLHGLGALQLTTAAVHLGDSRCDGSAHGGCEASCLLFWNEQWVRRVPESDMTPAAAKAVDNKHVEKLQMWSYQQNRTAPDDTIRYRCQATAAPAFSRPLKYWDVRQYIEDIRSRNISFRDLFWGAFHSAFRSMLGFGVGYRYIDAAYNRIQRWRGGPPNPYISGKLKKTPVETLGLEPGEWVRIKPMTQIMATLDTNNKNRGLWFVPEEMGQYCGKSGRVVKKVHRLINERTGEMIQTKTPSVVIDGMYCSGTAVDKRLFCPRASALFWREIWLERTEKGSETHAQQVRPS